jgi:hypothetical protein
VLRASCPPPVEPCTHKGPTSTEDTHHRPLVQSIVYRKIGTPKTESQMVLMIGCHKSATQQVIPLISTPACGAVLPVVLRGVLLLRVSGFRGFETLVTTAARLCCQNLMVK